MALFFVSLGLLAGSFINCLVWRLNQGLSPIWGRSICPKCKHKLSWNDNIPLLSFILLRSCCRYCHSPISGQYPLVELTSGLLTLLIFNLGIPWAFSIFNLIIVYILLAIFISDLLYMTIPDQIIFPGILISLFHSLFISHNLRFITIIIAFAAAGFFYLLFLITKGRGMGMGDVKLAGFIGLVLDWPKILIAFYLAFLTGALSGVILILLKKKKFGQNIPFGPFLTTATFISLLWGEKIYQWGEKIWGLQ